jgi:hypothetical protein
MIMHEDAGEDAGFWYTKGLKQTFVINDEYSWYDIRKRGYRHNTPNGHNYAGFDINTGRYARITMTPDKIIKIVEAYGAPGNLRSFFTHSYTMTNTAHDANGYSFIIYCEDAAVNKKGEHIKYEIRIIKGDDSEDGAKGPYDPKIIAELWRMEDFEPD